MEKRRDHSFNNFLLHSIFQSLVATERVFKLEATERNDHLKNDGARIGTPEPNNGFSRAHRVKIMTGHFRTDERRLSIVRE